VAPTRCRAISSTSHPGPLDDEDILIRLRQLQAGYSYVLPVWD
jgi:hypothetical protein